MSPRRDRDHPGRPRSRSPPPQQCHAGTDQLVSEPAIAILASSNQAIPPAVSPSAERHSRLGEMFSVDPRSPRPLSPRLDQHAVSSKKSLGASNSRRIGRGSQRGQIGWSERARLAVQRMNQELHVSPFKIDVLFHLRLLVAPQRGQPAGSCPKAVRQIRRGQLPPSVQPGEGSRRLQGQQLDSLLDSGAAHISPSLNLADSQAFRGFFQRIEYRFDLLGCRERRSDEVARDLLVLGAAQQDTVGSVERSACAPDLLILGHHRPGPLVVDNERQVRLVEAHSQCRCSYQRLDFIGEQRLLENRS